MGVSTFEKLNAIDCSKKVQVKNGLTYLSWAWAWGELKKVCPHAQYKVFEREDGRIYWDDGKTCWVKVGVRVDVAEEGEIEHIEYLPIMDFKNKSIPVGNVTSFDVNKAIQRALTKAIARHGLGLYIYAGEDLPEGKEDPCKELIEIITQKIKNLSKEGKEFFVENTGIKSPNALKGLSEDELKDLLILLENYS